MKSPTNGNLLPGTRENRASAIIAAWHLNVATEHLSASCESAQILHPGTAYAGLYRAAFALCCILSDPSSANDYGPLATADEILRCLLGNLAMAAGEPAPEIPKAGVLPEVHPIPSDLKTNISEPPKAVVEQALLSLVAPEVPQGGSV